MTTWERLKVEAMAYLTLLAFFCFGLFLVCGLCGVGALCSGRPGDKTTGIAVLFIALGAFLAFLCSPWLKEKTEELRERYTARVEDKQA